MSALEDRYKSAKDLLKTLKKSKSDVEKCLVTWKYGREMLVSEVRHRIDVIQKLSVQNKLKDIPQISSDEELLTDGIKKLARKGLHHEPLMTNFTFV